MFDGAVNVLDYVMEDYMVLSNYVLAFENGVVDASNSPLLAKYDGLLVDYSTVNGSGRIEIITERAAAEAPAEEVAEAPVEEPAVEETEAPVEETVEEGGVSPIVYIIVAIVIIAVIVVVLKVRKKK